MLPGDILHRIRENNYDNLSLALRTLCYRLQQMFNNQLTRFIDFRTSVQLPAYTNEAVSQF